MKGFIELTLQGRRRLIATSAIVGITERVSHNNCALNLNASLVEVGASVIPTVNVKSKSNSSQFETESGVTYDIVKKLIEESCK